jgi:hypothetical protein
MPERRGGLTLVSGGRLAAAVQPRRHIADAHFSADGGETPPLRGRQTPGTPNKSRQKQNGRDKPGHLKLTTRTG